MLKNTNYVLVRCVLHIDESNTNDYEMTVKRKVIEDADYSLFYRLLQEQERQQTETPVIVIVDCDPVAIDILLSHLSSNTEPIVPQLGPYGLNSLLNAAPPKGPSIMICNGEAMRSGLP